MRTRSFIGLILLVALLIVASTPALLQASAHGVERLGIRANLLQDHEADYRRTLREDAEESEAEPAEPAMVLKGHTLDPETGDLRDTASGAERAANQRGRLSEGDVRVRLPGQLEDQDAYSRPPVYAEDGMLLDSTGCPVFEADADLVATMADEEARALAATKVGAADDAAACEAALNAQLAAVDDETDVVPADRARLGSLNRQESERLWLELMRIDLFTDMLGYDGDRLIDTRESARALLAAD